VNSNYCVLLMSTLDCDERGWWQIRWSDWYGGRVGNVSEANQPVVYIVILTQSKIPGMDVIGPNYVTWRSVIHSSYGPRDNALNLVFLFLVLFLLFLVDFRVLHPNLMSARLALLSIFVKTPKSKMAADPRGRNGKKYKSGRFARSWYRFICSLAF